VINLFQPSVGSAELDTVREVFGSNWLGAGTRLERFERLLSQYIGRPPAQVLTVSSCTEGLFQAMAALGLEPGDEVVMPTVSFLGAAHAVRATGARVVLCDVDPRTLNPTVDHIEAVIGPSTKAVSILHYGGAPGAVIEIAELAEQENLTLVEDAACSLGSFVDGEACGTFGDIGVWSFDPVKLLTTGDGGMIWCRDEAIAARISHAIRLGVGSSGLQRAIASRWWEIDPSGIGRRATMNDVAAAIGLAQLEQLPDFLRQRREIAATYDSQLAEIPWLTVPDRRDPQGAVFYYWIQVSPGLRDRLATHLLQHDVYTNFRYWPLHMTRMYGGEGMFPGAESAAMSTLLLPVHQGLTDREVERVVDAIRAFPVTSPVSRGSRAHR
jgi:dTDP-4-amino-4,6-dideoxygalactose transaminase